MKKLICNFLILSFLFPAYATATDKVDYYAGSTTGSSGGVENTFFDLQRTIYSPENPSNNQRGANGFTEDTRSPRTRLVWERAIGGDYESEFSPNNVYDNNFLGPSSYDLVGSITLNPVMTSSYTSPQLVSISSVSGATQGAYNPNLALGGISKKFNFGDYGDNSVEYRLDGVSSGYTRTQQELAAECADKADDVKNLAQAQADIPTCNGLNLGQSVEAVEDMARQMSYYQVLKQKLSERMAANNNIVSNDDWMGLVRELALQRKNSSFYDMEAAVGDVKSNFTGTQEDIELISLGREADYIKELFGCEDYQSDCASKVNNLLSGGTDFLDAKIALVDSKMQRMTENVKKAQEQDFFKDIVKVKSKLIYEIDDNKCNEAWVPANGYSSSEFTALESSVCQQNKTNDIYGQELVGLVNDVNDVLLYIDEEEIKKQRELKKSYLRASNREADLMFNGIHVAHEEKAEGKDVKKVYYNPASEMSAEGGGEPVIVSYKEDAQKRVEELKAASNGEYDVELIEMTKEQAQEKTAAASRARFGSRDDSSIMVTKNECAKIMKYSNQFVYECEKDYRSDPDANLNVSILPASHTSLNDMFDPMGTLKKVYNADEVEPYDNLNCKIGEQNYEITYARPSNDPEKNKEYRAMQDQLASLQSVNANEFINENFGKSIEGKGLSIEQIGALAYNPAHAAKLTRLDAKLRTSGELSDTDLRASLENTGVSYDEAIRLREQLVSGAIDVVAGNTDDVGTVDQHTVDQSDSGTVDDITIVDNDLNPTGSNQANPDTRIPASDNGSQPTTIVQSSYAITDENKDSLIAAGSVRAIGEEEACRSHEQLHSDGYCVRKCPRNYIRVPANAVDAVPLSCIVDENAISQNRARERQEMKDRKARMNTRIGILVGGGVIAAGAGAIALSNGAYNSGRDEMASRISSGYAGMYSGGSFSGYGSGYGYGSYGSYYGQRTSLNSMTRGFNSTGMIFDPTVSGMAGGVYSPYSYGSTFIPMR